MKGALALLVVVCAVAAVLGGCSSRPVGTPGESPGGESVSEKPTVRAEATALATDSPSPTPPASPAATATRAATETPLATDLPATVEPTPTLANRIDVPDGDPTAQASYVLDVLDGDGSGAIAGELAQLAEVRSPDEATVEALSDIAALLIQSDDPRVNEAVDWLLVDGNAWKLQVP